MANNPIQIVLNAQSYVNLSANTAGGSNKDFFAGYDNEFIAHKNSLSNQFRELEKSFTGKTTSGIMYAKVELQTNAWAKSHRPIKKLFPEKEISSLSGPDIGTMLIEITAEDIPRIIATVQSAEPLTNWEEKNGKRKAKPSRTRSEVGAIKSVRMYGASDKRRFSLDQALKWLSDPRTGRSYYVETFFSHKSITRRSNEKTRIRAYEALRSFEEGLKALDASIEITRTEEKWTNTAIYIIRIGAESDSHSSVPIHQKVISFLDDQPIVKSVVLPPILQSADIPGDTKGSQNISSPDSSRSYPVVGIIDSGVSIIPELIQWCVGDADFVPKVHQDLSHGTFIAGLICAAEELNQHPIFNEAKCQFFDLALHPTTSGSYEQYYPRGFIDFLEQLDSEIPSAKEMGVRIFNMSLAVTSPVSDDSYSLFANLLDEISDKHDVLFILPAGNLDEAIARDEWPSDPDEAVTMLLSYRYSGQDRIYQPADSIRALVVGALNPPGINNSVSPSRYTRRGPGPSLGAKPDIAHIGGRLHSDSGLCSFQPDGTATQSCGTSFAAPLAARTVAVLNHIIDGGATRETLLALVIHHATTPSCLSSKQLQAIKKDFVGAGLPCAASDTLSVGDHEITLVFNGVINEGKELNFQFSWPSSLVGKNGSCSGNVKTTLVYRPPIDRAYGGEFIRANMDVFLRQEEINSKTGKVSFSGRLKGDGGKHYEKELIQHGAKWWPVKKLEGELKNVGNSSQWKLVVEPLARINSTLPDGGLPFTVIFTISDPGTTKPVFNEMRQQLQSHGATIVDIRSVARVLARDNSQ